MTVNASTLSFSGTTKYGFSMYSGSNSLASTNCVTSMVCFDYTLRFSSPLGSMMTYCPL